MAQVLLTRQLSVVENQILDREEKLLNLLSLLQRFWGSRWIVEELYIEINKQTDKRVLWIEEAKSYAFHESGQILAESSRYLYVFVGKYMKV